MPKELNPKAFAFMRPLNQSRNVSHDQTVQVVQGHNAQMGAKGGKRIFGDFGASGRDGRNQRGFSGVREAD